MFLNFLCHARAGMAKNTHFLEQVSRVFGKDDEIIVVRKLRLLNESQFQSLYVHFSQFLNTQWKLISPFVPDFLPRAAKVARGL